MQDVPKPARDAIQRLRAGIRVKMSQEFGEYREVIETLIQAHDSGGIQAVNEQYNVFKRLNPVLDIDEDENLYPAIELDERDLRRIDGYPYTGDFGQAEAITDIYREKIRFSPGLGWLIWTGSRWAMDDRRAVVQIAAVVARARQRAVISRDVDPDDKNSVARKINDTRHAIKAESRPRLEAALNLAETMPDVVIDADRFDSDNYVLGAANGIVDLTTGRLLDPRPADNMTKRTDIPYFPDAPCPRWEQFIHEIFDGNQALIDYVHRSLGYSLTGDTSEQCFWILHGLGSNGKSTFLETVQRVGGDYASNAPFNTFTEGKSTAAGDDLARLRGQRLVTASETKEGSALNEERVKAITGGDRVTARFLYGRYFTFTPRFKVWLAVNHKPTIKGTDRGIWRRVRLIPFDVSFEGRADKTLPAKLENELPGILAWFVRGALAWHKHGLTTPPEVTAATAAYQNEMDVIGNFLDECCLEHPNASVKASQLYQAYETWTQQNGLKALSNPKFSKALQERGFGRERLSSGYHWQQLGILADDEL